jgi:carboxyl-terminal processing protease
VYGGGGIMPDIFVPIDTTRYTDYHREIVARGVLNKVTAQYIDKNRAELKKKYTTFEKFKKNFEVDEALLNQLKAAADKEKIEVKTTIKPASDSLETAANKESDKNKQFETSKPLIKLQIKALVARDLWEMNQYYQIMDAENESLQKAVEILSSPGAYEKILK